MGGAMQRIVVGIDGSAGARQALRWAIGEGRFRGATVEAVHAWQDQLITAYPVAPPHIDPGATERAARRLLDDTVAAEDTTGLAEPVATIAVSGPPALALAEHAKGADLLVVGSRGRGGFTGLLLGSVSQQLSHHAPCPLVIVPGES
jgi:nucleotide-binding universal stress UspA family protein